MQLELQMKLNQNEKMAKLLKDNSYWYKELNRNPDSYKNFVKEMKEKYRMRATDKVSDAIDNIDIINSILQTLK